MTAQGIESYNRTSATDEFIEWYINNYKNSKRLVKDMNTN